jgi:penicillin-binding protein 1A
MRESRGMTAAYAAINNRGIFARPIAFDEIYGPDGELLWSRRVDGEKPRRCEGCPSPP